jgi:hypothetical protein
VIRKMRPQVTNSLQVAAATQLPQATVAGAALYPVAPKHLRAAAKHCLELARHSLEQDFLQATLPEQALLRPVAPKHLRAAAKHCFELARHSLEQDFLQATLPEQAALARVPLLQGRLYRCLPSQVRASFFRLAPVGRKCNPAVRYADRPTLDAGLELPIAEDRYQKRRNRGELVGCGSKNNRSRHKSVCLARPFQISASDKCRCPLRRFAVRDVQSANPECKRGRARKRRASPAVRERVE